MLVELHAINTPVKFYLISLGFERCCFKEIHDDGRRTTDGRRTQGAKRQSTSIDMSLTRK